MTKKYAITGKVEIEFGIEVEADSLQDALECVDTMDLCSPEDMVAHCWDTYISIEEAESSGQQIWEEMPRSQRTSLLVEAGQSDADAMHKSYCDTIPEEVQKLL